MNSDCPEIERLNSLWLKHNVTFKKDRDRVLGGKSYYPMVQFSIDGKNFELFINDEYEDLKRNYPLLNFCLVLRELEGYAYTPDFEIWCQERFLDSSSDEVRQAFENLAAVFPKVKQILGEINSQVSDFDFELNAGAAQALRRST